MLHREEASELLAYEAWANEGMARILARVATPTTKIRKAWAHMAAAEELWYARCIGADYKRIRVWPDTEVHEASQRLLSAHERWAELARSWTDADLWRRVEFTNSRGEACADVLGDIVRHLVNHGTHHRAQIAMLLRESGTEPESLDYIVYCRAKARGSR